MNDKEYIKILEKKIENQRNEIGLILAENLRLSRERWNYHEWYRATANELKKLGHCPYKIVVKLIEKEKQ